MDAIIKELHQAAAENDVNAAARLLKAGADPYAADAQGRTAFNHAASNGLDALALMTEAAFRDTQRPQKNWPQYGLNTPSGKYGSTLLTYAAKVSPVVLVREMIAAGADISIVNGSGWTLLHCAAVMPGRLEVIQELARADLLTARSTHVYETDYAGHKVVFDKNLTALGLCEARLKQDPLCPQELAEYRQYLVSK